MHRWLSIAREAQTRESRRRHGDPDACGDEYHRDHAREPLADGQHLLGEDQRARRPPSRSRLMTPRAKSDQHQPPAAADAEERRARRPSGRRRPARRRQRCEDEVQRRRGSAAGRRPSAASAGRARRRRSPRRRRSGPPRSQARKPGSTAANEPVDAVGERARRPSTRRGSRRGRARSARARARGGALARDPREEEHHRRDRRQHHRRHHRHPDPDVPAERAEVGARAGVHPAHALEVDDPGDERGAEQGASDVERDGSSSDVRCDRRPNAPGTIGTIERGLRPSAGTRPFPRRCPRRT